MASAVYPLGIAAIMKGDITGGLDGADIKAVLVDTADYTYNAAHDYLDDVPAGARVATSDVLASKTIGVVGTGVFDAADSTLATVTGDQSEAVVIYWDTGNAATSILLSYNELTAPVTPNGGNIILSYSASGIFSL